MGRSKKVVMTEEDKVMLLIQGIMSELEAMNKTVSDHQFKIKTLLNEIIAIEGYNNFFK